MVKEYHSEPSLHQQCECYRLFSNLNLEVLNVNNVLNTTISRICWIYWMLKIFFFNSHLYEGSCSCIHPDKYISSERIHVVFSEETMLIACTLDLQCTLSNDIY